MVTKELSEAAVEFNCILENSSKTIIEKIPIKFLNFMKEIASKTYEFNYDKSKSLNEQNLKPETRRLIALVYQDYICNDEQKKEYIRKSRLFANKMEDLKREKYNPDNIFKNKNNYTESIEKLDSAETATVEYKEKNFLQKLFDKIKKLFRKKIN